MSGAFPIFVVDDLPAVRSFYEGLGYAEGYRFPPAETGEDPVFVVLARPGGEEVGLATGASDDDPDRVAYWVYVDDVDATVEALRRGGADVVTEPEDKPWGERVASVRDPAGTLVHLGQEAPSRTSSSGPTP